eukprot:1993167-Rhodomonas_salina.6
MISAVIKGAAQRQRERKLKEKKAKLRNLAKYGRMQVRSALNYLASNHNAPCARILVGVCSPARFLLVRGWLRYAAGAFAVVCEGGRA